MKKQLFEAAKLFCYDKTLKELKTVAKTGKPSKPIIMAENWSESFLKLHISEKGRHRSESKTFGLYEAEDGVGMSEDIIEALMLTCETCHPGRSGKATTQIKVTASAGRKEALQ